MLRSPGEEEEEEEEAPALLAALELSCVGLRRCLRVWEDPRTETIRGHVRPQPGDGTGTAAFSHHPVHRRVAERGAVLHALLRHGHRLRLARRYARRLKATSDFLRRLLALPELSAGDLGAAPPLRELCQELRAHAGRWSGLRRRTRGDPWLWPLQGDEPVARMRRALLGLARQAAGLAERHAEARLRALVQAGPVAPALLTDLFQGLEIYNQVVGDMALELGTAGGCPHAFPAARVLGLLAAERGRLVAERLQPLLQLWDGGDGARGNCWEDAAVPWPPERGATADTGPSRCEEPLGLARELRVLCGEDEELMGLILGVLVASTDGLRHRVLCEPEGEKPLAAKALLARYRPLFWGAAAAALGHGLGVPHGGMGTAAAQELSHALAQAGVPRECEEELGGLCLRLLCQGVLRSWNRDFARALGSGLSDTRSPAPVPVRSGTARCLRRLFPALAFALRCLRALPACLPGRPLRSPCLRLQVLGCCLATAQAARSWLTGSACRYRAARALPQLLLLTQGDLPLLKMELDELVVLVSGTFPEPAAGPPSLPPVAPLPPPIPPSAPEHQLCRQIRSVAASIQLFSGDALQMFGTDCKRVSAEIFTQTMPLGKHWRGGPRAGGCLEGVSVPGRAAGAGLSVCVPPQSCPAPPARTRWRRRRRCWARCCRSPGCCPATPRPPPWCGPPRPSWRPGWIISWLGGSNSACRELCSCVRTWSWSGSCWARNVPGCPPKPGSACSPSASSSRWTGPSSASCSNPPGGPEGPPALGARCAAAAPALSPTRRSRAPAACTAWRPWRRRRRPPRPSPMRGCGVGGSPSSTSRGGSSNGWRCGCTGPGSGGCPGCAVAAVMPPRPDRARRQ